MASIKNAVEKAEAAKRKINRRYDITIGNMIEIGEKSDDIFSVISNSFAFGYMQGLKAAKAEVKKGGRV